MSSMRCDVLEFVKDIVKNVLIVLISTFFFLLVAEILRGLIQYPLTQLAGPSLIKLATIFYVFPFYLVAVLLGKERAGSLWRLALLILVSFLLWNKDSMCDSVVLEVSFLFSFICLLGLEQSKKKGTFR